MSYDIELKCGRCHRSAEESLHPTYNLTPIFHKALTGEYMPNSDISEMSVVLFGKKTDSPRGLRILDGMLAADTITMLEAALARLNDPEMKDRFIALEPENKWGTQLTAIGIVDRMLQLAKDYPEDVWSIR